MGSSYVDARYGTFNNATGNQLNVAKLTVNPKTTLDTLPYSEGASWNPNLVCLRDTRKALIDDIIKWIHLADESGGAEIFWLSDVAGAGKSAIAHTIAQYCDNHGLLGSSFFFDRNIPDRRTPQKLFSTIARDLVGLGGNLADRISLVLDEDRSVASACQTRQFEKLILEPSLLYRIGRPVVIVIDGLDEGYDLETLKILRDKVPKLPGTFRIFMTSRPLNDIVTDLSDADHVHQISINIHGDSNQRDIEVYICNRLEYISSRRGLAVDWPGAERTNHLVGKSEGLFIWVSIVSEYLRTVAHPDRKLSTLLYKRNMMGISTDAKMDALYSEVLSTRDWTDDDFVCDYHLLMGAIMAAKTPLSMAALKSLHRRYAELDADGVLRLFSSLLTGIYDQDQPIQILHLSFRDFITCRARSLVSHERFYVSEKEHSQRLATLCLHVLNEDLTAQTPGTGYLSESGSNTKGIPCIVRSDVSEAVWYACRFWMEHIIEIEGMVLETCLDSLRKFLGEKLTLWIELLCTQYPFESLWRVRAWFERTFPTESEILTPMSGGSYARTLFNLADQLFYMNRLEHALEAMHDTVDLYRQLAADHPEVFNPDLASSLNSLSCHLSALGHREQALEVVEEAVDLYNQLAVGHPEAFNAYLTMSLNNLSLRLSDLGHRERALEVIWEAVDLRRQLAADHPEAFNPDLAMSLNNLSLHLSNRGHWEQALEVIEEAVYLYHQLAADHPEAFNPKFAMSLNNLSVRLSDLGHREQALQVIEKAVNLYCQLVAHHPKAFNPNLAMSLNNLSLCLSNLGHWEQALKVIQKAVDLRRQLAAERPEAFNPDLAMSLNNLSVRLSALGHWEQSLEVIQETVDLYRQLAVHCPEAFNPNLAMSLNNLSLHLSNLGHWECALEVIREAVDLQCQLAADHPEAFNPNLAMSLNNLSLCLSNLGHWEWALEVIQKAVDLRCQLASDHPEAFNPNLAMSLNNLSLHLSNLGHQEQALEVIQETVDLYRQLAVHCPEAFHPNLTISLNNLSLCLSDLGHRERALEVIQETVDLRRQLAAGHPEAFNPNLAISLNNLSVHLSDLGHWDHALVVIQEAVDLYHQLAADHPEIFNHNLTISLNNLSTCLSDLGHQECALQLIQDLHP